MNTYREPAERPPEEQRVDPPKKKSLLREIVLPCAFFGAFLAPLAVNVWMDLWKNLTGTAFLFALVTLYLLALRWLMTFRARREAQAPNFARDELARETEVFLAREEDQAIRTRVFLPPTISAETTPIVRHDDAPVIEDETDRTTERCESASTGRARALQDRC